MSLFRYSLNNLNIDFMKAHRFTVAFSVFCIIASIVLVAVKGLNVGIDFSGGILIEAKITNLDSSEITDIRKSLTEQISKIQIQNIDDDNLIIKTTGDEGDQSKIVAQIKDILSQKYENIEYRRVDVVGPQIGYESIRNGALTLLLSLAFMTVYIWVRFDWQFGLGGFISLLHDAILTLGLYAISGLEFNATSIAAILTVVGYSINDSIVIYDRIRENLRKFKKADLVQIINSSINSTLSRTILTASSTLLALLALILFGGEVLRSFSIATFFGIAVGTYSSVYISTVTILLSDPRLKKEKEEAEISQ